MIKQLLSFLLPILFLLTCQVTEEEKIYQVVNRRQEALQKKDLSLYLSCISRAYQDKKEDFSGLEKRIDGYFKTFDRIAYSSWDRSVKIEGNTATVTQQFYLESVYKCAFSVMPDLIRHPEGLESTGFRLSPE
jgi:hypothetical protein